MRLTPGVVAALALLVTLAGIGGVIATSVTQRTREFGVRMALGASRTAVLRMVLRQGLTLVIIGLGLGMAGAAATGASGAGATTGAGAVSGLAGTAGAVDAEAAAGATARLEMR